MKKRKLISVCLSIALVCAMTACAAKPSKTQPSPQSKEDFALKVGLLYDPDVLDPTISSTSTSFLFIDYLFEGLMGYENEKDGIVVAKASQAKSYSLSEDSLTYRFVLRDDIFWSDGKPVVAEDFVYSWQRLVDPATGSNYASLLSMVENAQEILGGKKKPAELAVKAVDKKTFEVKLSQKCPYFTDICATPPTFPVRKDIVEANGGKGYTTSKAFISNGAYSLENWEHDDKLALVKNPNYYGADKIGPSRLDFSVIADSQQAQSLFSNGQLDAVYEIDKKAAINMAGTEQLLEKTMPGLRMVYFDNQKAPFNDPNIRKAFSLAIDRNAIVSDQFVANGTPLAAFVPYGITDPDTGADFRKAKESYFSVKPEDYAANCE
ncbi:MAG: peptide ABC transporter substrate-binding protein, partial [Hydrogenoanaerobacterium sp.]